MSISKLKELTTTSSIPGYNSKYAFKKKNKYFKSKTKPEGTGKNRKSIVDNPLLKPKEYGSLMIILKDIIREIIKDQYLKRMKK